MSGFECSMINKKKNFSSKFLIVTNLFLSFAIIRTWCSDLTVISPRFRNHVRSKTEVIIGDVLKLNCAAVGRPMTHVHWYRNDQLILPTKEQSRNDRIKANRSFLKINKVEPGDEGEYACHVWNQAGQIWRNFTVSIVDLHQHRYPASFDGKDYSAYRNPSPIPKDRKQLEEWLGEPIDGIQHLSKSKDYSEESSQMTAGTGLNGNKLDLPYPEKPVPVPDLSNMLMNDGMTYKSNASSSLMNNNPRYFVDNAYYVAPYWIKPDDLMETMASPAGRQVKLTCRANGKPEPQLIWFKDGKNITADSKRGVGSRYQIKKWALILEDVVPSDDGKYTCMAFNKYGNITHNYDLKVIERIASRPIISPDYPKNMTVFFGDNATFECPVLSDLQPHIEWVRHCTINGSYDDERGLPCLERVISDIPHDWDQELPSPMILFISNVTFDDEGWYTCIAGNQIGLSYRSAWLSVLLRNETMFYNDEAVMDTITILAIVVIVALVIMMIMVCVIVRWLYVKARKKNLVYDHSNDGQHSPLASFKKVVKVYRNDSSVSDQNLIPKITVTPRYHSSRFSQELNIHESYVFPNDPVWEIPRENLNLIKSCGQGAFGQVYMSELRMKPEDLSAATAALFAGTGTGTESSDSFEYVTVAVKMLKDNATERELLDLFKEMEVMKQICQPPKHPNIINLIGCCSQDGPLYVVVEYCAHGNLLTFLRDLRPQPPSMSNYEEPNSKRDSKKILTTQDLVQYALQVARGMSYLSEKKCIHRDLAARNVLVSQDYVLKIGDFGLARDITEDEYYRKNSEGRLPIKWMAPECLNDRRYTVKSDVWSYGVLLWEIMTLGGKPYPSIPFEDLYQFLKDGRRMCQPHNCPNEIYDLMNYCWRYNPEDRCSFDEIAQYLDKLLAYHTEDYVEVVSIEDVPTLEDAESLKDDDDNDENNVLSSRNMVEIRDGSDLADLEISADTECGLSEPLLAAVHRISRRQQNRVSNDADVLNSDSGNDHEDRTACVDGASEAATMPPPFHTLIYSTLRSNSCPATATTGAGQRSSALRPISETSELFDMGTDDDDDRSTSSNNYRKSRPSATDSGNPSSPGCSFEGSSDSMDSKYSLSGTHSSVFDHVNDQLRLKRRSDPIVGTTELMTSSPDEDEAGEDNDPPLMDNCRWPVPKQLPKRASSGHNIANGFNVLL